MFCLALNLSGCSTDGTIFPVLVNRNVMIPMCDGVNLATDIYYPVGLSRAPAILVRTVYGKNSLMDVNMYLRFASKGYYVLVQDVRGRSRSEGAFYPFLDDSGDGKETIAWIRGQHWFDGNLGTYGPSFLGITQWLAAPDEDIDAMYVVFASHNLPDVTYTGGQLHLLSVFNWAMLLGDGRFMQYGTDLDECSGFLDTLPLEKADDLAGSDVSYFNDLLDMQSAWDLFSEIDYTDSFERISSPVVTIAGWYDFFLGPQLNDYQKLLREGGKPAGRSVLIVGPWGHGPSGDGTVDFGDAADMHDAQGYISAHKWFDYWLKDNITVPGDLSGVSLFVMGDNTWRAEEEWPLARTVYTNYYLDSGGSANTRSGDGTLSVEKPAEDSPFDYYSYDPENPVPTLGGNNLISSVGPYDQSVIEDRTDVLCYTSPVLQEDLEVTGPLTAVLYAASDAVDTDFTMKLVDVYPDGTPVNIQDGIVRALYRYNDPALPEPLTPGAIEQYSIDLWATANVFKAGHRIRVEVSSSNFPRFNRNLNSGEYVPGAVSPVIARQSICHTSEYPSHIVLPIIPR
ncbi:MAG: CocE/NonD family hydrolase [Deltaproteobacteria bacterium]|nr:CocE/NonD family hydrolase [Deltaproteobacteria bacterium]